MFIAAVVICNASMVQGRNTNVINEKSINTDLSFGIVLEP